MKLARVLIGLLTLAAVACGGTDGPDATYSSSSGTPPAVNVSGVWAGGVTDSLQQGIMTWRLTQSGGNVSGTVSATSAVGAPLFTGGTIVGSVLGGTLTFTVTIPKGSIADLPDCAITATGSVTDITATGMSGTYTGTDSCRGTIVGGRLNLVKQ